MIIALLIAAAPEFVVSTVAHRPQPILVPASNRQSHLTTAIPIRVQVTSGTETLYNGTLRVTRNASASYAESRNEAPESPCESNRYSSSTERYSLSIQINLRDDELVGQAVNVSVEWKRPSSSLVCGAEGTRTVAMVQTVPLAPGQIAKLQGDANLAVAISRPE
jgi:hypothetical protein